METPPSLLYSPLVMPPDPDPLEVDAESHRLRVDRFIAKARPDLGRRLISSLLRGGAVEIDGVAVDRRRFVKRGERIAIRIPPELPQDPPREIVRTAHLLAMAKPPGMPTTPGPGGGGLLGWVERSLPGIMEPHPPGIVHRIDRDTSGVVIMSRTPEGHREIQSLFRGRQVEKVYHALVAGIVRPRRGTIDRPLARDRTGLMRVDPRGIASRTIYQTLRVVGAASLLEIRPATGRMHQIRVHLQSIGHPVAADPIYGDPRRTLGAPRLWLHASRLSFPPAAAARLGIKGVIECPLWPDLVAHLGLLGFDQVERNK